MPLYVYACQNCGETLERMQSFSAAPLSECETCGGELRRVLQPVGIIFRGNGFYTTDYGRAFNGGDGNHERSGDTVGTSSPDPTPTKTSSNEKSSEKKEASAGASSPVGSTTSSS